MNILEYYNSFKDESESLYLLGNFNDEITAPLIGLNSIQNSDSVKITRRISFLTVESFQNIIRHGHSEELSTEKVRTGGFYFSKTEKGIILNTVNKIKTSGADKLTKDLNEINELTSSELKKKYIDSLLNNGRTENGGAGVGFIAMARKTVGKIQFKINKIDENISEFMFQSNLLKNPELRTDFIAQKHHDFMLQNNILLLRKGIFDHDTMLMMNELLSVKLNLNLESKSNKSIFFIIGEFIQNIYNHGYKSENGHKGIFLIKKNDDQLSFFAGNFIESKYADDLKQRFDRMNNLNGTEIKDQIKAELFKNPFDIPESNSEDFSSGIGLLEILKICNRKIEFDICPVDNKLSFLTVGLNRIEELWN